MGVKLSANAFGHTSLVLSLSFWILGPLSYVLRFPKVGLSFTHWTIIWIVIWVFAFVLAVVAARRGSRLWIIAAFLPLANFLLVSYVLSV